MCRIGSQVQHRRDRLQPSQIFAVASVRDLFGKTRQSGHTESILEWPATNPDGHRRHLRLCESALCLSSPFLFPALTRAFLLWWSPLCHDLGLVPAQYLVRRRYQNRHCRHRRCYRCGCSDCPEPGRLLLVAQPVSLVPAARACIALHSVYRANRLIRGPNRSL